MVEVGLDGIGERSENEVKSTSIRACHDGVDESGDGVGGEAAGGVAVDANGGP